jgi:hypothetical protein
MTTLSSTKKTEATEKNTFGCDFCGRTFLRETTISKHICEYKQRHLNKDLPGNRIGFQAYIQFYNKNTNTKKTRTYQEFIKSAYYIAFVKFGMYCVEANVLNVSRYVDYLLKNQIKIDSWNTDSNYTKFLIHYLRDEDHLDAISRTVEAIAELAETNNIQIKDVLRYCNANRICYLISIGKISPWVLYQSDSGKKFLDGLDETQVKIIIDYINPEQWAIKFKRFSDKVKEVKELLSAAGF